MGKYRNSVMIDKFPYSLKGIFSLKVKDLSGNTVKYFTDNNLIVTGARGVITHLLGGGSDSITKVAMGIGITAAAASDTALTAPGGGLIYATINETTYPTAVSMMFSWVLGYDEGNGNDITEYGLLTTADVLFSRKVYAAFSKTDSFSFEGEWTLGF